MAAATLTFPSATLLKNVVNPVDASDAATKTYVDAAISGNASVLTSTVNQFTGNGSTTVYTLSVTPSNANFTTVNVQGVAQPRTSYTVVSNTLTFSSAPPNGALIEITTIGGSVGSSALTVVSVPATSTSTGSVGQIAYDSSYVYICVSTNRWVKSAIISTW